MREELSSRRAAVARLKAVLVARGNDLDALRETGELDQLVADLDPSGGPAGGGGNTQPAALGQRVPLIKKAQAFLPQEFKDLGLPRGFADEYISCGDVSDPDAFAARIVGDSMSPAYGEGDVVVFSPLKPVRNGSDCFARLEPDHESTFKRVYFEAGSNGGELVRLQPLNDRYPARTVERERVAGLFAAARVIREIG
ncbi:MAG: S24 family peptidase [Planctomycetota bacterium]